MNQTQVLQIVPSLQHYPAAGDWMIVVTMSRMNTNAIDGLQPVMVLKKQLLQEWILIVIMLV